MVGSLIMAWGGVAEPILYKNCTFRDARPLRRLLWVRTDVCQTERRDTLTTRVYNPVAQLWPFRLRLGLENYIFIFFFFSVLIFILYSWLYSLQLCRVSFPFPFFSFFSFINSHFSYNLGITVFLPKEGKIVYNLLFSMMFDLGGWVRKFSL